MEGELNTTLSGKEVVSLMRRHQKTIAGLSFAMNITQQRIRQVRVKGLADRNAVRDWLQFITGEDPGPLPERYRISRRDEEADCGYCGCPLFVGDQAYEYGLAVYCSLECCRKSRHFVS